MFHCLLFANLLLLANHSALDECAGALRTGSPHGGILGVGKGSGSAPEPRGAEMSVLGHPQTTVIGNRVYGC